MTEEELSRAMREHAAWMNAAPKPSLENGWPRIALRLEYLEADASAQRTAILRLEKIARLLFKSVCALGVMCAALAVAVLT
jgi:hypothetical protein